jgi:hypothetical protein
MGEQVERPVEGVDDVMEPLAGAGVSRLGETSGAG